MCAKSVLIAGTGSNTGKTTVALGLMAAFRKMGKTVQGYKCGPDYVDPLFQTMITKRPARNLDSWMCDSEKVENIFQVHCQDIEIAIIEGVMGMFDGKSPLEDIGSAAEIARITQAPVLLVLDCSGLARSAAAIVKGFQDMADGINIIGVVANFVGSRKHYQLIHQAVSQVCQVPVLGYLTRDDNLKIPERKLGLAPIAENMLLEFADTFIENFDLPGLEAQMGQVEMLPDQKSNPLPQVRLAVLKDDAFPFYYADNLDLLKQNGAELIYFSTLNHDPLPANVDGLMIGGGYPERYPKAIRNEVTAKSLINAIHSGLPTYVEGGGMLYLLEKMVTEDKKSHPMLGLLPGCAEMSAKLQALGYREVSGGKNNPLLPMNEKARGHAFHYAKVDLKAADMSAYIINQEAKGVISDNITASMVHLHFHSNPRLARRFIDQCLAFKQSKNITSDDDA